MLVRCSVPGRSNFQRRLRVGFKLAGHKLDTAAPGTGAPRETDRVGSGHRIRDFELRVLSRRHIFQKFRDDFIRGLAFRIGLESSN